MPRNPTPAQLRLIRDAAERPMYVYRQPGRAGGEISPVSLDIAFEEGWLEFGPYEPMRGKRLVVTDVGRALIADTSEETTDA